MVLYTQFDKVKSKLCNDIIMSNAKAEKSSSKKDLVFNEVLEKL